MTDLIEEYILQYPDNIQDKLFQIKAVIEDTIPEAASRIAWGMPTYTIGKSNIIHFSVHRNFITLHIGTDTLDFFKDKLVQYSSTKSSVHLKFEDDIPKELIREIVKYNMID